MFVQHFRRARLHVLTIMSSREYTREQRAATIDDDDALRIKMRSPEPSTMSRANNTRRPFRFVRSVLYTKYYTFYTPFQLSINRRANGDLMLSAALLRIFCRARRTARVVERTSFRMCACTGFGHCARNIIVSGTMNAMTGGYTNTQIQTHT